MSLLDSLPSIIAGATSDLFRDATLKRNATAYDINGDLITTGTDYAVKVIEDGYSDLARVQGIPSDQRKFTMLADGLAVVPNTDDRLVYDGDDLRIINVERDPAVATYTVETR